MGFMFFAFLLFGFYFVVSPFYLRFHQAYEVLYHQESSHYLQIKHNREFLLQRRYFTTILVFFVLVTILKK
jgi:hypothetical protein